jgi:Enoyl-CoA hydratase/isomerase/Acetyltransferase (GNAT) domain
MITGRTSEEPMAPPEQPSDHITTTIDDGVATIVLDRPAALNALTSEMLIALAAVLDRVAVDDAVDVIVLTGAGRAFSAGVDLKALGAIGWRPARDQWGRGLATEGAGAVLADGFGRCGLDEIVRIRQVANEASGRVMAELGFTDARTTVVASHRRSVVVAVLDRHTDEASTSA